MTDQVLAVVVAVVAAIVSGGAMGTAVIAIAKKAVNSIVEQNGKLTAAIENNTHATVNLTQMIQTNYAVEQVKQDRREEHLAEVKSAALVAFEESRKVNEKLKGRL